MAKQGNYFKSFYPQEAIIRGFVSGQWRVRINFLKSLLFFFNKKLLNNCWNKKTYITWLVHICEMVRKAFVWFISQLICFLLLLHVYSLRIFLAFYCQFHLSKVEECVLYNTFVKVVSEMRSNYFALCLKW
jgi:hypothetical protein